MSIKLLIFDTSIQHVDCIDTNLSYKVFKMKIDTWKMLITITLLVISISMLTNGLLIKRIMCKLDYLEKELLEIKKWKNVNDAMK
jgi:hypothetical protein